MDFFQLPSLYLNCVNMIYRQPFLFGITIFYCFFQKLTTKYFSDFCLLAGKLWNAQGLWPIVLQENCKMKQWLEGNSKEGDPWQLWKWQHLLPAFGSQEYSSPSHCHRLNDLMVFILALGQGIWNSFLSWYKWLIRTPAWNMKEKIYNEYWISGMVGRDAFWRVGTVSVPITSL